MFELFVFPLFRLRLLLESLLLDLPLDLLETGGALAVAGEALEADPIRSLSLSVLFLSLAVAAGGLGKNAGNFLLIKDSLTLPPLVPDKEPPLTPGTIGLIEIESVSSSRDEEVSS